MFNSGNRLLACAHAQSPEGQQVNKACSRCHTSSQGCRRCSAECRCAAVMHSWVRVCFLQGLFTHMKRFFASLSLAALVEHSTLILHGGLFRAPPAKAKAGAKRRRSAGTQLHTQACLLVCLHVAVVQTAASAAAHKQQRGLVQRPLLIGTCLLKNKYNPASVNVAQV